MEKGAASSVNRMVAVAIALVSVVFIMLVSQFIYGRDPVTAETSTPIQSGYLTAKEQGGDTDSDGDGLADWEELLWNTDPDNPDSDGDGASDGEERASGRDPGKAGGNSLAATVAGNGIGKTDTETQAVGRELFNLYLQEFSKDPDLDAYEQEQLAEQVLRDANIEIKIPSRTRDDLYIVSTMQASRQRYIDAVKANIKKLSSYTPGEFDAMSEIIYGSRSLGAEQLLGSVAQYNSHADELVKVPVPDEAAEIHLTLINSMYEYAVALEHIAKIEEDPMFGVIGLSMFVNSQTTFQTALQAFVEYDRALTTPSVTPPSGDQ